VITKIKKEKIKKRRKTEIKQDFFKEKHFLMLKYMHLVSTCIMHNCIQNINGSKTKHVYNANRKARFAYKI
jgi:hypothetical protein